MDIFPSYPLWILIYHVNSYGDQFMICKERKKTDNHEQCQKPAQFKCIVCKIYLCGIHVDNHVHIKWNSDYKMILENVPEPQKTKREKADNRSKNIKKNKNK